MTPDRTDTNDSILSLDRTMHEPSRLLIVSYLYVVESADFMFLMNQTGLTRGNLSSHLTKLERAGYVDVKKEFVEKIPRTLLQLTPAGRNAFDTYRQSMKHVLDDLPG